MLRRAPLLLIVSVLGLAACSVDRADPQSAAPVSSAPSASAPASAAPPGSGSSGVASSPAGSTSASGSAEESEEVGPAVCRDVAAAPAKDPSVSEPTGSLAAGTTYVVRLQTSCGRIDIRLDQAANPKTANAFAHLAREGYYNGTAFHRIVPGFVIQGGDPSGTGSGGPSWQVVEAPSASARYTTGVVAMAKTAAEAPGTSGSQFFVVATDDAGLPPDYAIAGRVVAGQDVVDAIAALGRPGSDGPPPKPVVTESATLIER